jgi:hypothetical protein
VITRPGGAGHATRADIPGSTVHHLWYSYSMTNTEAPAAPAARPEWTEFLVCPDCAVVIANGDASGLEDPAAHLAEMDRHLSGYAFVACSGETCDELCGGFRETTCGACGTYTATDGWHLAAMELPAA